MAHPSFDTLLGFVEETLSPEARREVENHLSLSCNDCERLIARIQKLLHSVQGDESAAPQAEVLEKALGLYRRHLKESKPAGIQIIANLLFDSRLDMSASMVRGSAQTRRVLYSAQQIDIDLQITPAKGLHNLIGQVLDSTRPDKFIPAFVSIKNNETGMLVDGKGTDDLGQFGFQNIQSGRYDLVLEFDTQEVEIRSLELIKEI
ncbi:MAG TPA: hypothetical protein VMC09_04220 [Anaerolineales bacterium]|nr:hypothetical protein [Anaerolineales bacterium]